MFSTELQWKADTVGMDFHIHVKAWAAVKIANKLIYAYLACGVCCNGET